MENESAPMVRSMCKALQTSVLAALSVFLPFADSVKMRLDTPQRGHHPPGTNRQTLENVLCLIIKRGISKKKILFRYDRCGLSLYIPMACKTRFSFSLRWSENIA